MLQSGVDGLWVCVFWQGEAALEFLEAALLAPHLVAWLALLMLPALLP